MSEPREDTFICPNCGEEVRVGSPACPGCGSDETTGWSEDAELGNTDYGGGYGGEDDFDYEAYVRREFGDGKSATGRPEGRERIIGAVALLLVIALLVFFLR